MSGIREAQHKEVVREFFRIKNERDYDALDAIFAENFTAKFARHFGEDQPFDLEYLKGAYREYPISFPDLYYDVHHVVAEDDWAVARLHYRGTHLGMLLDYPPTGKKFNVNQHLSFRFEDGKIAEMFSTADFLTGLWIPLGIDPMQK